MNCDRRHKNSAVAAAKLHQVRKVGEHPLCMEADAQPFIYIEYFQKLMQKNPSRHRWTWWTWQA